MYQQYEDVYCKSINRKIQQLILDYTTKINNLTCIIESLQGRVLIPNITFTSSSSNYTNEIPGAVITNTNLLNRTVSFVIISDIVKNKGFTKLKSSNQLSFTDGTTLINGQIITIVFSN